MEIFFHPRSHEHNQNAKQMFYAKVFKPFQMACRIFHIPTKRSVIEKSQSTVKI